MSDELRELRDKQRTEQREMRERHREERQAAMSRARPERAERAARRMELATTEAVKPSLKSGARRPSNRTTVDSQ